MFMKNNPPAFLAILSCVFALSVKAASFTIEGGILQEDMSFLGNGADIFQSVVVI